MSSRADRHGCIDASVHGLRLTHKTNTSNCSQGKVRFRLGKGWLVPYVHDAIRGLSERESKTVTIGPDQAYGPCASSVNGAIDLSLILWSSHSQHKRNTSTDYAELTADIPMDNAPAGLQVGDKVKLSNGLNARVTNIDQVRMCV